MGQPEPRQDEATPGGLRYELKVLALQLSLPRVLALVRQHPALFTQTYPDRTVNNIYFDTPALRDYLDHRSGTAPRGKTRLRWYGRPRDQVDQPVLERKIKYGQVSDKVSEPLPPLPLDGGGPWPTPDPALVAARSPSEASRRRLEMLRPTVANRYRRHYFRSADGHFRLTVDSNLQSFAFRATGESPACPIPVPIIIELKFAPRHAEQAAQITNALPYRLSRCSKYVLGVQHLGLVRSS